MVRLAPYNDKKVLPIDSDQSDGSKPKDFGDWKKEVLERYYSQGTRDDFQSEFDEFLKPKLAAFPVGTRLTPERVR
ncbi:hypothetical protein McaMca56_007938, partial [Microsporum canis]